MGMLAKIRWMHFRDKLSLRESAVSDVERATLRRIDASAAGSEFRPGDEQLTWYR